MKINKSAYAPALLFLLNNAWAEQRTVTVGGETVRYDRFFAEDTSGDGRNDRISCYDGDALVLTIYDTNNDGKPDLWLTFGHNWQAKSEMRDTDRDGEPDDVQPFGRDDKPTPQAPVHLAGRPPPRVTPQPPNRSPISIPTPAPPRAAVVPPTAAARQKSQPALRLTKTRRFVRVWTDKGSGADEDFATFRALAEGEFFPIGDTAIAGPWTNKRYAPPKSHAWLIASGALAVKPPMDYRLTWTVAGSPAHQPFSSWQPIPPRGYRCLGDVGAANLNNKPPRGAIRCVPQRCVEPAQLRGKIWDDNGSNARDDFSAWSTPTPAVYLGNRSHGRPARKVFRLKRACFEQP